MEKLTLKGEWDKKKDRLKQMYAELTDDDLQYTEGRADELVSRIQKRLGVSREKAREIIRGS